MPQHDQQSEATRVAAPLEFSPTEYSITELEDRLEFTEICDNNCDCKPAPTATT